MSERTCKVIPIILTERDERRFWAKVGLPDEQGCMPWLASLDVNGYGQFHLGGRTVKTHQVAWWMAYGEFPSNLEPDHTCNVRQCTAPEHLDWVTHAENNHRIAMRSETCRSGHRWDEQVPLVRGNGRECRICRNEGKRRRYHETGRR